MKRREIIVELVTFIAIGAGIGFTLALLIEYRNDWRLLAQWILSGMHYP